MHNPLDLLGLTSSQKAQSREVSDLPKLGVAHNVLAITKYLPYHKDTAITVRQNYYCSAKSKGSIAKDFLALQSRLGTICIKPYIVGLLLVNITSKDNKYMCWSYINKFSCIKKN